MSALAGFYLVGAGAVFTALAMITSRDAVHAVLFMIGNFLLTAILYLMLAAPFVAAVQVLVYAGAIMVLFLFVVMIIGSSRSELDEPLARQRLIGSVVVVLLGALMVVVATEGVPAAPPEGVAARALQPGFGSPHAIGRVLLADYALGLEIVSVLLVVAIVGAVVLAYYGSKSTRSKAPRDTEGDVR